MSPFSALDVLRRLERNRFALDGTLHPSDAKPAYDAACGLLYGVVHEALIKAEQTQLALKAARKRRRAKVQP